MRKIRPTGRLGDRKRKNKKKNRKIECKNTSDSAEMTKNQH
jgi:hypothetical protein